ncbi:hypothetical protein DSCO28_20590 [Desulfosarcina ovata subsp. sediminis]|uniref:Uncharacterized protein n=1 Tax=Desulfosarcina ovata subsp. sediminis TaxID=885957 RepID=A0A5K7ZRG0_9BACT|nr:hypothetical protein DSCO28_20590 [Desulfosarcina ovata subsp. sediminis]
MHENESQNTSSHQSLEENGDNIFPADSISSDTLNPHAVARTRKEETFYNSIDLVPPFFFSC